MQNGLTVAQNARVLYVDLNAFFASIEQQYHPELRGLPVAVVSHNKPSGTILASSYEAKRHGVTTGTKLRDARLKIPHLQVRETDASLYRSVHMRFRQTLEKLFGPEVQMRSIDEAAIFLAPNWQGSTLCHQAAQEIKQALHNQVGSEIHCSIGIAPNAFLAKLATELQKPDGLVEITLENTSRLLAPLSLTDLPGIAQAMANRLIAQGVTTPLELYNTPTSKLRNLFGIWGQYWWWRLHGYEPDPGTSGPPKSLSHEHVLHHWFTKREEGWPILAKMSDRLIHRLRHNQQQCKGVGLSLSLVGLPRFTKEIHFDATSNSYSSLLAAIRLIYEEIPPTLPVPVRKITIWFTGLQSSQPGWQESLFTSRLSQERASQAIEKIRKRHGFEAVRLGSSLVVARTIAKEQPGFGKIRDLA